MKLVLFTNMQECIHLKVDAFYFNHIKQNLLHHFCLKTCCPIARLCEIPFLTRLYRLTGLYKVYFIAVLSVNTLQMFSAGNYLLSF